MLSTSTEDSYIKRIKLFLFYLFFFIVSSSYSQKLVVGYYPDWLKTSLPTSKIQFQNLTHIIHSFAWPTANGSIEHYSGMINSNLNLKVHEANKKILMAFGGAGLSDGFGPMVIDSVARGNFVNNVLIFLTNNNYDGIDIDWEFPQNSLEKVGLTNLVKELRSKFDTENPYLLISMAVNSSNWGGQHFEFEKMEEYIDWFAMMGYDISGGWLSFAGHNAPLYRSSNDWSWNDGYNYLNSTRSISNSKILLGMPFFGKQFNASDLFATHSGSVANLRYNEIANNMKSGTWEYNWDEVSKVPYLLNTSRTKFVTYDDSNSVKEKVKFALEKDVSGVMIWALGQDVIDDSQPLLEMIARTINTPTSISKGKSVIPTTVRLYNNYPNPFNPSTKIKYDINKNTYVELKVYNSIGVLIETLVNETQATGSYEINFISKNLPSGVYFYNFISGDYRVTKSMLLLK